MLTDEKLYQSGLTSVSLSDPVGMLRPVLFNHTTLPDSDMLLENFNIIVIDNFESASLNAKQFLALRTWVNKGGVLLEVGGPDWKRTLGSLPADLIPVELQGTTTLPAGTSLLEP